MTNEQINIAIAKACGWGKPYQEGAAYRPMTNAPDYCNDLNAMHEAEKVLINKGVNAWWEYAGHINRHTPSQLGTETAIHATARQRAEAFLRTLGKWEGETK